MNPPKKIVFVGVDGHGGSGKSTLAVQLGEILAAQLIHTDDFASRDNPLDWWPLLIDRVFRPIADGARSLSYPRSSWWPDHHPQPVTDQPVTDLMILEGVGALRTEFRPYLTFGVFVDTPKDVCLQRGFERDRGTGGNDDDQVRAIWEEWYRQEETIMSQYRPQDFADIVVDGTSPTLPQLSGWLQRLKPTSCSVGSADHRTGNTGSGDGVDRKVKPKLIVFDVNETLLDVGVLKPVFAETLGDAAAIGEWFARLLHGSLVANHTAGYRSFGEIAREALAATAAHRNLTLEDDTFDTVIGGMLRLPAHPDVAPALTRLRDAGYRMVTLTNGSPQTASAQLAAAGIADHFQVGYTVEPVGRFKPDPAPYLQVLEQEALEPGEVMMVAAHDWDVLGAHRVGMVGAFVNRPGTRWNLGPDQPDLTVTDLTELANVLT